jgi:molybdate transport system substrate-binding protein
MARLWGLALATVPAAGLMACGSSAAALLKKVFTQLGDRFMAENSGTFVDLSFAGSSDFANRLTRGAEADVFASAGFAKP